MAYETADQIITRELTAACARLKTSTADKRARAIVLAMEADADEARAIKMLDCEAKGRHKFKTVPGSGMMGDRFEEKCSRCGWIHTS
jgi:hypothetical protein